MPKKTKEEISYNMSRIKSKNTGLEKILCEELFRRGINSYIRNDESICGKPDFAFEARKIAVFCDGDFWHGYDWENAKKKIKTNPEFWINKIERNIERDKGVNKELIDQKWTVYRFWGHDIKKNVDKCADIIEQKLHEMPSVPYKTIDLCAGIGGIRRGFERTGKFQNVLSSEIDKYACLTYENIFGDDPLNNLNSIKFKRLVEETPYDILLAGFPCQSFSRVGLEKGFKDTGKGRIFFKIKSIIKSTRPSVFFLENVDHLVTHDGGKTFKRIIDILVRKLNYHVIGVTVDREGKLKYKPKDFIRNSKNFGVPQNRPRTYIIGFDNERFSKEKLDRLPEELPRRRKKKLYKDLNGVLEHGVDAKFYMASGYWDTLIKHRAAQEEKGYGFGYRIVNEPGIKNPIANTLLATGGSGRERNLIIDWQEGISGQKIKSKKTVLNDMGIRVMTPTEWGKLQGFINYAFVDREGVDHFSFPEGMPDAQKYKQFGNSVTIPVIEEMANFILSCLKILEPDRAETVMKIVRMKKYITKQDVIAALGITTSQANILLKNMLNSGEIKIVCRGKYSKYSSANE